MEPGPTPTTNIPFTRRHRWRWWMMAVIGSMLATYGLVLLTSPAWARFGIFGQSDFWLWVRGEVYFVFGFMQAVVGIGYIRLSSRPAEAIRADHEGISVRRLYGSQHLAWRDIVDLRKGRTSILIGSVPITFWNVVTRSSGILRLDTTMVDADLTELTALVDRYKKTNAGG